MSMSIAGPVSREMLDHCSHIRMAAKRSALDAPESPIPKSQQAAEQVQATVN
jgi:hypothetical protein